MANTLTAKSNDRWEPTQDNYVAHTLKAEGFDASEDGTGRGIPLVPVLYQDSEFGAKEYDTAGSLRAGREPHHQLVAFGWNKSASQTLRVSEDATDALQASETSNPAVAFSAGNSEDSYGIAISDEHTPPLRAGSSGTNQVPSMVRGQVVRRLTPVECERLQGFPDNYTLVPYRGKPAADGPRYRACGNSMAVPVMRWIGERIEVVEKILKESESAA